MHYANASDREDLVMRSGGMRFLEGSVEPRSRRERDRNSKHDHDDSQKLGANFLQIVPCCIPLVPLWLATGMGMRQPASLQLLVLVLVAARQ